MQTGENKKYLKFNDNGLSTIQANLPKIKFLLCLGLIPNKNSNENRAFQPKVKIRRLPDAIFRDKMKSYKDIPREDKKKRFARLISEMKLRPLRSTSNSKTTKPKLKSIGIKPKRKPDSKNVTSVSKPVQEFRSLPPSLHVNNLKSKCFLRKTDEPIRKTSIVEVSKEVDEDVFIVFENIVKPNVLKCNQRNQSLNPNLSEKLWFKRPVVPSLKLSSSLPLGQSDNPLAKKKTPHVVIELS